MSRMRSGSRLMPLEGDVPVETPASSGILCGPSVSPDLLGALNSGGRSNGSLSGNVSCCDPLDAVGDGDCMLEDRGGCLGPYLFYSSLEFCSDAFFVDAQEPPIQPPRAHATTSPQRSSYSSGAAGPGGGIGGRVDLDSMKSGEDSEEEGLLQPVPVAFLLDADHLGSNKCQEGSNEGYSLGSSAPASPEGATHGGFQGNHGSLGGPPEALFISAVRRDDEEATTAAEITSVESGNSFSLGNLWEGSVGRDGPPQEEGVQDPSREASELTLDIPRGRHFPLQSTRLSRDSARSSISSRKRDSEHSPAPSSPPAALLSPSADAPADGAPADGSPGVIHGWPHEESQRQQQTTHTRCETTDKIRYDLLEEVSRAAPVEGGLATFPLATAADLKAQQPLREQQQGNRGASSSAAATRAATRQAFFNSLRFTSPLSSSSSGSSSFGSALAAADAFGGMTKPSELFGEEGQLFPTVAAAAPGKTLAAATSSSLYPRHAAPAPAAAASAEKLLPPHSPRLWGRGGMCTIGVTSRGLTVREVIGSALRNSNEASNKNNSSNSGEGLSSNKKVGGGRYVSWQSALCYSSKSYASLDRESLIFYLRMTNMFETHWVGIKPLPAAPASSESNKNLTAGGVDVYLVAPFLLRALRKVRLSPSQLQSLAAEEFALTSSSKRSSTLSSGRAELPTDDQSRHSRLPNPLRLRIKGGGAGPSTAPPPAAGAPQPQPSLLASGLPAPAESSPGVIDLFLCCGGKDMLALDWLPFVSRYLHFCLSSRVKQQQHSAVKQGKPTFNREAVVRAALGVAKLQPHTPLEKQKQQVVAEILSKAQEQTTSGKSSSNSKPKKQHPPQHCSSEHKQPQQQEQQQQQYEQLLPAPKRTIETAMEFEVAAAPHKADPSSALTGAEAAAAAATQTFAAAAAAEEIDPCLLELEVPVLVKMNLAFVLVDYPGYGGSQGDTPSPEGCVRAAVRSLAVSLRHLRKQHGSKCRIRLNVIGYSLGGAVALETANIICRELLRLRERLRRRLSCRSSSSHGSNNNNTSNSSSRGSGAAASLGRYRRGNKNVISRESSSDAVAAHPPPDAEETWFPVSSPCSSSSNGSSSSTSRRSSNSSRRSSNSSRRSSSSRHSSIQKVASSGAEGLSWYTKSGSSKRSGLRTRATIRNKQAAGARAAAAPRLLSSAGNSKAFKFDAVLQHLDTPLRPVASSSWGELAAATAGRQASFSAPCTSSSSSSDGERNWSDSESALGTDNPAATGSLPAAGSSRERAVSPASELRAFLDEILSDSPDDWIQPDSLQHNQQEEEQQQERQQELITFKRLVLVAAFTTTADCAAAFLQLPAAMNSVFKSLIEFVQDENTKWNNEVAMRRFCRTLALGGSYFKGTRLLIYHGTADRIVPFWMGARLFALAEESGAVHCTAEQNQQEQQKQEQEQQQREQRKQPNQVEKEHKQQQQQHTDRLLSGFRTVGKAHGSRDAVQRVSREGCPAKEDPAARAVAATATQADRIPYAGSLGGVRKGLPTVDLLSEPIAGSSVAGADAAPAADADADAAVVGLEYPLEGDDKIAVLPDTGCSRHAYRLQITSGSDAGSSIQPATTDNHLVSASNAGADSRSPKGVKHQQQQRPLPPLAATQISPLYLDGDGEELSQEVSGPLPRRKSATTDDRGRLTTPSQSAAAYSDTEACSVSSSGSSGASCSSRSVTSKGLSMLQDTSGNSSSARWSDTASSSCIDSVIRQEPSSQSRVAVVSERSASESPHAHEGSPGRVAPVEQQAPEDSPDCPECQFTPHLEFVELAGGDHRTVCSAAKFQKKIFQRMFEDEMVMVLR